MLWQFRLVVAGEVGEEQVDRLFDRAGDACVEVVPDGFAEGGSWVAIDRDAPSPADAIVSGVRDLDGAGMVTVSAAADDPLVTLQTIAERVGQPLDAVRSWPLPPPVGPHPRRPVFDWREVSDWLVRHRRYVPPDDEAALHAVTLALRIRALAPRLGRLTPIRSLLYT
ncbi:hypothetical protein Drose_32100 [Dactylosporangium roseum]|uniref:DNA-binding protein n=1 Tax=Dactylosporangium roseum TaxID=47989 RepID=A0ABY5Z221_9ACTN|nr:hypothetical protein [Dactylosporangium roseum]UWZ35704.1 hypothetical protein Drose_32100 [Dactylosporangium roseum]